MQGHDDHETLSVLLGLAWTLSDRGEFVESFQIFEHIVEVQQRVLGENNRQTLHSMQGLARTYLLQQKMEAAIELFKSVLYHQKNLLGSEHPETVETMTLLASTHHRHRDQTRLDGEAFLIQSKSLVMDHPAMLSLCNLGWTHVRLRQMHQASQIMRRIVTAQKVMLHPQHPTTKSSIEALAEILSSLTSLSTSPTSPPLVGSGGSLYSRNLYCPACVNHSSNHIVKAQTSRRGHRAPKGSLKSLINNNHNSPIRPTFGIHVSSSHFAAHPVRTIRSNNSTTSVR